MASKRDPRQKRMPHQSRLHSEDYGEGVQIPELGTVVEDADLGWYCSAPIPVHMLGGQPCLIVADGYDDDR
ncbi:hypothetical protein [Micromonospora sp. ATA51]|uniref:hypothetical protein n=1 Tax=Micromonospora sp. ATA51 TaxID=2806098 RepID=UPI001A57D627|nr:hypothetical protein [Micromonospora sp. ATA51]MBM0224763.1 hypothetical protein [Micromonospora sp. ATA51]